MQCGATNINAVKGGFLKYFRKTQHCVVHLISKATGMCVVLFHIKVECLGGTMVFPDIQTQ